MLDRLGFPEVPVFDTGEGMKEQAIKVLEEASELVEAAKDYAEDIASFGKYDHLLEEAADVNQSLMNLVNGLASNDTLEEHALRCFGRNFARGRFDCGE